MVFAIDGLQRVPWAPGKEGFLFEHGQIHTPIPRAGAPAQPWPTPCKTSQPTVWARLEAPSVPSEALAPHSLLLTQEKELVVEGTLLIIKFFLPSTKATSS